MRSILAPLVLAPILLAACSSVPETPAAMTQVQVDALYRERIMLPPGHVLTVRVEDVSLADAPARVMAEVSESLNGRAPRYSVVLSVPTDQIDPRHEYAARAEIRDSTGALRFTTDTRHSVLTRGAPNHVEIIMKGVR